MEHGGNICKYLYSEIDMLKINNEISRIVTEITHNHQEGLKSVEAIAVCGIMAKHRKKRRN